MQEILQQMFRKFQISSRLPNRYFPKIYVGCPRFHPTSRNFESTTTEKQLKPNYLCHHIYSSSFELFHHCSRKNVNILSSNRCKQIFPSPSIVAYKSSPNLRDLLVRSTLRDCTQHTTRKTISQRFKVQSSTLPCLSIFKTRPSQLHLHLHQRETTYT